MLRLHFQRYKHKSFSFAVPFFLETVLLFIVVL
nr:MAG TPA: hypothetical protein [Caudoviricetes sp.]